PGEDRRGTGSSAPPCRRRDRYARTRARRVGRASAERRSRKRQRRTRSPGRSAEQSPQVFVRLHVEPHGEERELRPGDEQERDQDDGPDADLVAVDPVDELEHAEEEARKGGEEAERIEEDERVEVADDVFLAQAPEEAA